MSQRADVRGVIFALQGGIHGRTSGKLFVWLAFRFESGETRVREQETKVSRVFRGVTRVPMTLGALSSHDGVTGYVIAAHATKRL